MNENRRNAPYRPGERDVLSEQTMGLVSDSLWWPSEDDFFSNS